MKARHPRNQKCYSVEFQVVDQDCNTPLLGRQASEAMKLIKVLYDNIYAIDDIVVTESTAKPWTNKQIRKEYEDVFTGDGCLGEEYNIEIIRRCSQ